MNIFTVRVGRNTRSGNFQELYQQTVSVADTVEKRDLSKYFNPRYAGFDLIIEQVEAIDISDSVPVFKPEVRREVRDSGQLNNFKIKLTDEEKKLLDEHYKLLDKANETKRKLKRFIQERYEKLPYTRNCDYMELEIGRYDVFCKSLSISSGEFFTVIKDGDTEKLVIEDCEKPTDTD
jgi:hypothetical protein